MKTTAYVLIAAAWAVAIHVAPAFADTKKLTFGVDYNVLAVPFVTAVQRGVREEAAQLGVNIVERDAGGTPRSRRRIFRI